MFWKKRDERCFETIEVKIAPEIVKDCEILKREFGKGKTVLSIVRVAGNNGVVPHDFLLGEEERRNRVHDQRLCLIVF